MPKEESVAPKERINVVYRPATGSASEEKELPLKLLVLGDFLLRPDGRELEDRKPTSVDKDTFNEVMARQNLSLSVVLPNRLSGKEGDELTAELKFGRMNDFSPDAIAAQVPQLSELLQIREALTWLRSPLGNRRGFRQRLEACIKDEALRRRLERELGLDVGQES